MQLEALAAGYEHTDKLGVTAPGLSLDDGMYTANWAPLIPMLMDDSEPQAKRAARFHLAMAQTLLEQSRRIRDNTKVNAVALSGGVFQNRVLTEQCIALLEAGGFKVTLPLLMPVNDAGISFGQIVEYGYQRDSTR